MSKKKTNNKANRCWEYRNCTNKDCPAYGQDTVPCWEATGHRFEDKVFSRPEEKLIQCCFKCGFFTQLKHRLKGRRWADITLLETLEEALIRSSKYSRKVEDLYMEVIRRSKLMNLLGEVSKIIARLDREEDIILAILTVITAREGLGFNRAFVFLRGPEYGLMRGKYALGPSSPEEAEAIWKILDKDDVASLEKLVSKGQKLRYLKNSPLTRITARLSIPLNDAKGIISRGIDEIRFIKKEELESTNDRKIASLLGLEDFCVCPIATVEDKLGILIADNIFTKKEITAEDAHLLEMVVNHATTSLRAAQLKESLNKNIESLKMTYRKLKANEERMLKAEMLAISGELTSSVIHEIKNPLVAIGGFAKNLLNSESLSKSEKEKVEIIIKEALRLEQYLEKLQSKVTEPTLESGNINEVLENNFHLLQMDFSERNVKLIKDLSQGIPEILFDVVKISEVFMNVVQNALEAVGDNGEIRVRTWENNGYVNVEISDNGSGISSDCLTKIFTPFFTTKEHGSGLGLAIAHSIIKDHDGDISVTSSKGEGTSFVIKLPGNRVKSMA